MATLLPTQIATNAIAPIKCSYSSNNSCYNNNSISSHNLNMVLQNYGFNVNSDDECTNEINSRKSVNYSDNMIAMSPFAGDYPPATNNYINYTDLDANYVAPGKEKFFFHFFHCSLMLLISGHVLTLIHFMKIDAR